MPPNSVENLISELGTDVPPDDDIMFGFKPSKPIVLEDEPPRNGKFPAKNKEQKEIQTLANTHAQGSRSSDKSFAELRKLMPSGSFVQIQKARDDGSLSFIGEFSYSAISPYGSIENYLAQVQRPKVGGGVFHVAMRDAASGQTVPAVPVHIEPLEKVTPEMNTDAVALKLAEMVGARPANERVEVQVAPNAIDGLRQAAAFLEEVKKPAAAPAGEGNLGMLLQFQQNSFDHSLRQAQENQKLLEDQRQQTQSVIAALTAKPSGPDPVVSELNNRFNRLEQVLSTPAPLPSLPPPAPSIAEIVAGVVAALTPILPVFVPLITPKPDTSGDTIRLMMEQTRNAQQAAEAQRREDERTRREEEAARRDELRRAEDLRREEQRRADDQRREDEKARREEQREEQRRADEQRREDEKIRREEHREEQRRADEKMANLIASMNANKPEGFSTKEVFEIQSRNSQAIIDLIQNQNSGQSPQDSLVEKMQEFAQLKEVIEMVNPPAADRSSGGDSTAATVIKALAPMAEGMFKALAPVMAQQMQQRPAPEIRYIQAPATVVAQPHAIVPVQPQVVQAPLGAVVDATPAPAPVVSTTPTETAPPEVVAGFQAIKNAQTPEQRVDSAVTMLMGLIHHPELSSVVLEMATSVAKKDQQSAVERMHGFLMYGVERGWITKQDVFLTLQAFLKGWDANRAKLLEQVPFLNMLTADPNETFVDLEGKPKKAPKKTPVVVQEVEEAEETDEEDEDEENGEDDENEEGDEEDENDENAEVTTEA